MLGNFAWFFVICGYFKKKNNFFQKLFQEYHQSVKQFRSRSGLTFCRVWSGSKLFAKVVSRWQKSPLAVKELMNIWSVWLLVTCHLIELVWLLVTYLKFWLNGIRCKLIKLCFGILIFDAQFSIYISFKVNRYIRKILLPFCKGRQFLRQELASLVFEAFKNWGSQFSPLRLAPSLKGGIDFCPFYFFWRFIHSLNGNG